MISIDPNVHHGEAVIGGTRMSVAQIVRALGSGDTAEMVATDYGLAPGDVREALEYAAEMVEAAGGMGPDQVREISGGESEAEEPPLVYSVFDEPLPEAPDA